MGKKSEVAKYGHIIYAYSVILPFNGNVGFPASNKCYSCLS